MFPFASCISKGLTRTLKFDAMKAELLHVRESSWMLRSFFQTWYKIYAIILKPEVFQQYSVLLFWPYPWTHTSALLAFSEMKLPHYYWHKDKWNPLLVNCLAKNTNRRDGDTSTKRKGNVLCIFSRFVLLFVYNIINFKNRYYIYQSFRPRCPKTSLFQQETVQWRCSSTCEGNNQETFCITSVCPIHPIWYQKPVQKSLTW